MFEDKRRKLRNIFSQMKEEAKYTPVDILQSFLAFTFPEICKEVETAKSLEDVLTIVNAHTSLLNIFHLKSVAIYLKLKNTIQSLQAYDDDTKRRFLKEVPIKQVYQETLIHELNRPLITSETVEFILKYSGEDMTLYDVQQVLVTSFHALVHRIILKKVAAVGNEISLLCYSPFRLSVELMRLIQSNKEELTEIGVLSVSAAGYMVITREEVLITSFNDITILL